MTYGEGKQLVSLIKQFREAKTHRLLIDIVFQVIYLGETVKIKQNRLLVSPTKWETLLGFIEKGSLSDVRKFHLSMIDSMERFRVDKIQKLEQQLSELKNTR